ncbi:cupin domain-containing protein [Neobacillus sp. FSL H8-0543]|uniref:cupin domain-containing protein n=1 Tax=Neobacillus sp. FSL H8-0543 TaxID=2954672 RepID=UPI0031581EA4
MTDLLKDTNYIFLGARVKPLLLSSESGGNFSVFEFNEVKGLEAPFHIHENEDEIWRVVEGEITFYLEGEEIHTVSGDTVFVPRGKSHTFRLKTETAKAILSLTSTDFENVIREIARPAVSDNELPNQPITKDQAEKLIETGKKNGLTILKHE